MFRSQLTNIIEQSLDLFTKGGVYLRKTGVVLRIPVTSFSRIIFYFGVYNFFESLSSCLTV